ncbi:DUF6053 domain-containing protein [Lysobacter enzymogenes]|uniref:DUF6053 domain-containing protein n=1 Tax=Lysobacter enzymogenes TaxID=69 RepID=UPI003D18BFEA
MRGFFVGGPSGPRLFFQVAAIGSKSIGPEGPPTRTEPFGPVQSTRRIFAPKPDSFFSMFS